MNRLVSSVLVSAGMLALAACGGSGHATSPASSPVAAAEPGVSTYLCPGTTSETLLQWRDSDGILSGTYESAQLSGQAPQEQVSSNSGDLSGSLDGTAITLNIGLSQPLYGTLSGSQLSLNVPQSDGTIQASTCSQASLDDWNQTVASLNSQAASGNQQANQAQASASASAAAARQEQQAQNDVNAITGPYNGLSGDVNQLASHVKQTDSDLTQTRQDAANGNGDNCTNASTTVYNDAATTVYNDVLTTVYNDVNTTIANDISNLRSGISTVQQDQQGLASSGLPGTPGAGAAISAAQAAISSAISAANGDIDHANGDLDTAYQVADSVGTGSCAGDGPGQPPSGVSHLS